MNMRDPGQLNRRITLQAPSAGQDALGQPLGTWSDVATVWADIRHPSGLQALKADAASSTVRASIRIRWRTGVTAAMRLVDVASGAVYAIRAVLPDVQTRAHLDLVCEVVT